MKNVGIIGLGFSGEVWAKNYAAATRMYGLVNGRAVSRGVVYRQQTSG